MAWCWQLVCQRLRSWACAFDLQAQVQEAVDAPQTVIASKVHAGTYEPFVVNKNELTIEGVDEEANPVIDAVGSEFAVWIAGNALGGSNVAGIC